MIKNLQVLGSTILLGCASLTAQTTHNIDWTTGVGAAASITVEVGDEIVWTNTQTTNHDVVSVDGNAPAGFGSGTMNNGDTYSFTFVNITQFSYFCNFHPGSMSGQITVVDNINCEYPTHLGVNGITQTSFDVSWTASPDEVNGYAWFLMNSGEDPLIDTPVDSGVTASGVTSITVSGLSPETVYDFYIETQCGGAGNSGLMSINGNPTLGLTQNELEGFEFYPNPASDILKLNAQDNIESVTVYNMMSQEVLNEAVSSNSKSMKLNISDLENGPYFLEIKSGNQVGVYKFIKK